MLVYRSDDGAAVPVYRYELPIIVHTHVKDRPDLRQFYTHEELHGRPIPSTQTDVSGGSGENVRQHRSWNDLSTALTEDVLKPDEALERIALFKAGGIPKMQPHREPSVSTNGYHDPAQAPAQVQAQPQPQPQPQYAPTDPALLKAFSQMGNFLANMQTQLNDLARQQRMTMQYLAETMMEDTDTDTDDAGAGTDDTGADGTDREGTTNGS